MTTVEPTPDELSTLQQATQEAMPYWIEFCRGRSDDAAVAVANVWVAIERVLGNDPQQVTNSQTVTTVTDGVTTNTMRFEITHAIWCPTPSMPKESFLNPWPGRTQCPNCSARVMPVTVGS